MYIANKTDRQSHYNGKSPKFKNKNKNKNPKNGSERIANLELSLYPCGKNCHKTTPPWAF